MSEGERPPNADKGTTGVHDAIVAYLEPVASRPVAHIIGMLVALAASFLFLALQRRREAAGAATQGVAPPSPSSGRS